MVQQLDPSEDIFLAALERTSAAERRAYLDAACAGDAALRERVEALLNAHDDAGSFLERPPEPLAAQNRETAAANGPKTTSGLVEPQALPATSELFGDFGAYRITGIIGQGGMGMVFLGHEARLHRTVAIKVLNPTLASDPAARERFLREARVAAAIRHEQIITIHAIGEAQGMPYLVMEHVQGESLQQRLDRAGPMPVDDVVRIAEQVAAGLAAAHAQGLIHRDIKPANILVETHTGQVKIADFGLARPVEEGGITLSGVVAGSPQYMSPEQARGLRADERSDLFSLGCLLYAMCVGHSPFHADSVAASLERVRDAAVEPVTHSNPAVPAWLEQIICRLLEKDPDQRIQSAREVIAVLGQRAAPPAAARRERRRGQQRRRTLVAATVLTAAAALSGGAALFWWRSQDDPANLNVNADNPSAPAVSTEKSAPPVEKSAPAPTPAPVADHRYGEIRRMSAAGQLKSLALSPDEKLVYVGGQAGNIHVWNLTTGSEVLTIPVGSPIAKLRMSGDGTRLAVASVYMLYVYDPRTGAELVKRQLRIPIFEMAFLPDHRHLLVASYAGPGSDQSAKRNPGMLFDHHGLTVVDASRGEIARTLRVERPCWFYSVACSPDGKWFAAGSEDGSVFLVDAAKGTQVRALKTTQGCTFAVAFSRDSQRLYASDNFNHLHGWRLSDFKEKPRSRFPHPFTRFCLSPDETWVVLNGARECSIFDLTHRLTPANVALPGHESVIADIAFLANGEQVVSCSWDSTVRLWKLPPRPTPK